MKNALINANNMMVTGFRLTAGRAEATSRITVAVNITLIRLSGFICFVDSDAAVKSDTTDYEILQYKGKWRTVDYIIFDGKQYFLMENQMYGAYTMPMLLNQYGQVIMKECNGSFDSESLESSGVKIPYILILSFSFSRSSSSLTWNG